MKTNFKKGLARILALCLAVTMFPLPAQAAAATKANPKPQKAVITSKDEEEDIPTYEIGAGGEYWILDAVVVKTTKSTNKKIFTVERREGEEGGYYVLVGHKPGTAYLKTTYTTGAAADMIKIVVHKPIQAAKKEITIQEGTTYNTNLIVWSEQIGYSVKSEKPDIAKASITGISPNYVGYQLKIKAKKAGTTTLTIKNNANKLVTTIKVKVTKKTPLKPVEDTTGTRRALVIGQEYCCANRLVSSPKDANAMKSMLENAGYSSVLNLKNANRKEIQKGIQEAFKGARKNDVSLFYYSGHGSNGGELCSFERDCNIDLISPKVLAKWLSAVPGKVIVILDCCFSGGVINKEINGVTFRSSLDALTVNQAGQNMIQAFQSQDPVAANGGALCQSKFKVLTACTKSQYSYCSDEFGFFTKTLIDGAGYQYEDGKKLSKAPADINKDKKLTLEECYDYVKQYGFPGIQTARCFPARSGFKILER